MLSKSAKIIWVILVIELYIHVVQPGDVKISALFGEETSRDDQYKKVIEDGIRYLNRNKTFLSDVHNLVFIESSSANDKPSNSVYSALDEVCDHISSERPSAFILPEDKCPQCNDIAGISSHASNPIFSVDHGSFEDGSIAFKMHPSAEDMNAFFIDILHYFNWLDFVLVYDDNRAYQNLEGMLNEASLNRWNVTVLKLGFNMMNTIDSLLEGNTTNIFVYCSSEAKVRDLMNMGLDLFERGKESPTTARFHWLIGNLDLAMGREFSDALEDSNVYMTRFTMNYTREHQYALPTSINTPINEWPLRERLAFDAVIAVGHALKTYRQQREDAGNTGTSVLPGDTAMPNCPTSATTPGSNELTDHLRQVSFEGVTGNVAFDEMGNRVNYTITIFSGQAESMDQMRGDWVQSTDFWEHKWQKKWENKGRLNTTNYQYGHDRVIRVVSVLSQPFLFHVDDQRLLDRRVRRQSGDSPSAIYKGNDRFEGYIMDLLERIKTHVKGLDFDYEVELVPDGNFGIKKRYSDIWTGMVGEVVRKKVDIAAGPLTVTSEREEAVDFTYPFMSSGIQMLIKHPKHVKHNPFRIFFVFGVEVWFINLLVFLLVSLLLFVFNYFDPYEWKAVAERGETYEENAGNFGCLNSMWFCTTTLCLQSFDAAPRSNAGRCLAAFWWIFVLITVFLFLTNLTFFVNTTKRLALVKTPHDLLEQVEVSYGVVKEGATYDYFWKSGVPAFQRIWQHMNTDYPVPFVMNVSEGVDKVRASNGDYAFIGESGELSYRASQKPCDLMLAGGILSRTSYALAVQKGSPLADQLSSAIETLRDTGVLEDLQREWWELDEGTRYRCGNLTEYEREGVFSLSANDLQGVYYLLMIGIGLSCIMFIADFICKDSCTGRGTSGGRSVKNGGPSHGGGMGGGMPIGGGQEPAAGGADEKMWI